MKNPVSFRVTNLPFCLLTYEEMLGKKLPEIRGATSAEKEDILRRLDSPT